MLHLGIRDPRRFNLEILASGRPCSRTQPQESKCAVKASFRESTYYGIQQLPEGMKCYLSFPDTSAASLLKTNNLKRNVWELLVGQETQKMSTAKAPVTPVETTSTGISGDICTACDPHDPNTWGIIRGQVGCSIYNLCTSDGLSTQKCGISLVLSSDDICDFSDKFNEPCLCK
ncbi:uncharacterized protein [Palaemon carinicauda]|uniref:uncharacterized protein n=1 Tax=Palaemon carinicauda TaxID=392227 RepID=UPI0035B64868